MTRPTSVAAQRGLIRLEEKYMTKISAVFATVLILAAASSNVAFAAMPNTSAAITQGEAINDCRAQEQPDLNMRQHHEHLATDACVARLTHVNQSTAN
jgi:hypothetical protein